MAVMEKKLERMAELQEELRRMERLEDELSELRDAEEDNHRLRESNEQLRHEIDKRDQAVTEAVDLICQLEAKVDRLESGGPMTRPAAAYPSEDPGAITPKGRIAVEIPQRSSSRKGTRTPDRHRRVSPGTRHLKSAPSFLRDETARTAALRSLYAPEEEVHPGMSALTQTESCNSMNEMAEVESPRLSALSECSELNPDSSFVESHGFDELEIPVRPKEAPIAGASLDASHREAAPLPIGCLLRPYQHDMLASTVQRKPNPVLKMDQMSLDSGSLNSSSQRTPLESVFGSSRLPPTPDTMSTAYAGGPDGSAGSQRSHPGEKPAMDPLLPVMRRLGRPRSAGELTSLRSLSESMDLNMSDCTLPRASLDDDDEPPTIYPLNSITARGDGLLSQETLNQRTYDYDGQGVLFNEEGLDKVLSNMDQNHYAPAQRRVNREPAHSPSSSPPLTPQDWIEAAKSDARTRTGSPRGPRQGPLPAETRLVGARAPSQSSFLGRRHSIDAGVRDAEIPGIPTLDLSALELDPTPLPDPSAQPERECAREQERRRRISLRTPFFGRSITSRWRHEGPAPDMDGDDGAPAPIVRKSRQTQSPTRPTKAATTTLNEEDFLSGSGPKDFLSIPTDFSASLPTYADNGTAPRPLAQSFTESHFATARSSKDHHRRRGSLGIFGWMKGASGLGSTKKSDSDTSTTLSSSVSAVPKDRASSRLAPERAPTEPPKPAAADMASMNVSVTDFAPPVKPAGRTDEDEGGWRPRYMDRRPRRG